MCSYISVFTAHYNTFTSILFSVVELAQTILVSLQVQMPQSQSVAPLLLEPSGYVDHARKAMELTGMEVLKERVLQINVVHLENARLAVNNTFLLWEVNIFCFKHSMIYCEIFVVLLMTKA